MSNPMKVVGGAWNSDHFMLVQPEKLAVKSSGAVLEEIDYASIVSAEQLDENEARSYSARLGALGLVFLGPVGIFAGLFGNKKKEVACSLKLSDGREALITGDSKDFLELRAKMMTAKAQQAK